MCSAFSCPRKTTFVRQIREIVSFTQAFQRGLEAATRVTHSDRIGAADNYPHGFFPVQENNHVTSEVQAEQNLAREEGGGSTNYTTTHPRRCPRMLVRVLRG